MLTAEERSVGPPLTPCGNAGIHEAIQKPI